LKKRRDDHKEKQERKLWKAHDKRIEDVKKNQDICSPGPDADMYKEITNIY
jgi:hypothetical protein